MTDYLFDSGILILHLHSQSGYPELTNRLTDEADVCISSMTRFEIVRGMNDKERTFTFSLLNSLETLNVTSQIADQAGELMRSWKSRGVTFGDADAIIASTALHHELALVTTNAKHFPMADLVVYHADKYGKLTLRE